MYVGQIVHVWWRGRCTAAIIVDFWEDQTLAHLTTFERGGVTQMGRVVKGEYRQDQKWHLLSECPDVEDQSSHTPNTPLAEEEDTDGNRDEEQDSGGARARGIRQRAHADNATANVG